MNNQDDLTLGGLFGWGFASASTLQAQSFDIPTGSSQTVPIWSLDLPSDPKRAQEYISSREEQVRESTVMLDAIPERIDRIAAQRLNVNDGLADYGGISEALPDPESELMRLLGTIKRREVPQSFESSKPASGELNRIGEQFQADSERLLLLFSHFAWVDTRVLGRLIGRTEVGWTGNMNTSWTRHLDETQMNLHRRNLETAMASRNTSLRALTLSLQTAVKLSVLLATPGSAILALPVVWKFVNQVLARSQSS